MQTLPPFLGFYQSYQSLGTDSRLTLIVAIMINREVIWRWLCIASIILGLEATYIFQHLHFPIYITP